jgi:hypothetical protein
LIQYDVNNNVPEIFDSFETIPRGRGGTPAVITYLSTDPTYINLPDKNNDSSNSIGQFVNTAKDQYNELISMLIYLKNTETSIKNHKL